MTAITGDYRETPEAVWHTCECHVWEDFTVRAPDGVEIVAACAYCGAPRCDALDDDQPGPPSRRRCVWERHHQCSPRREPHEYPSGRLEPVGG